MNAYRFDARQLRRFNLDPRRLPPAASSSSRSRRCGSSRVFIVGAAILLALQSWLIVGLLASRAQRRGAQAALAEQLRFETLVSKVLTTLMTSPTRPRLRWSGRWR